MLWPLLALLQSVYIYMPMLWLYMQLCMSVYIDIGVLIYVHGLCVVMPPIDPIYIHGSDYVGIFMLLCIAFVL